MIFTETKKECNELGLSEGMKQGVQLLHGDISQKQRELTLQGFREGRFRCLVATNVAARGLDIPEVDLVLQCEPPKDIESYIHRSGRTGRAGRAGMSIICFSPAKEYMLQLMERKAGIKFNPISAPSRADIIKASARDCALSFDKVPLSTQELFHETAQTLIESKGALSALASALAFISGNTAGVIERSAMSSMKGFVAYLLHTDSEIHSKGMLWSFLDKYLPTVKDSVKGAKLTADGHGVVFDVPTDKVAEIKEAWTEQPWGTLEIVEECPELQQEVQRSGGRGGGRGGGGGRSGGGGRGGGGGWRGGGGGRGGIRTSGGRGGSRGGRGGYSRGGGSNAGRSGGFVRNGSISMG
jgi:ATP-dependent RNA helicase DDX21